MKKTIIRILLLLTICSCNEAQQVSNLPRFRFGNEKTAPLQTPPTFDRVEIVPLETTRESLLSYVETVECCDSLLFVKDLTSLSVFNRNGKFVAKIGRQGAGPHEYNSINAFYIDRKNKHVVIVDVAKSALITFDFYGNPVAFDRVPVDAVNMVHHALLYNDSTLLLNHYINYRENMAFTVLQVARQTYHTHCSYAPITASDYMYPFSKQQMAQTADAVHFIMPLCDTVFSFSDNGFAAKYVIDMPAKLPPREEFQTSAQNSYSAMVLKYGQQGFFSGFTAIYETKNNLLLNYKYDGMVLGYYLGNKNIREGNYYLNTVNNPVKEMPFYEVKHAFDNTFISVVEVGQLLDLKHKIAHTGNAQLAALQKVVDSLQYDDNPVVIFYSSND